MLYQLHESLHAAWMPWRLAAESSLGWMNSPLSPLAETPYARSLSAGLQLFERTTRRYGQPVFGLDRTVVNGAEVAVTEATASERTFCTLTHFHRDTSAQHPRVLIVPPLSGHFATLTRGTIEALLPEHDVYVTAWTNPRDVPVTAGTFDLDDNIDYLMGFMQELGPDLHVLGICQAAVPTLAAVSLMSAAHDPRVPRTMTLMGGPIDTRYSPTVINDLATTHSLQWFDEVMLSTVPAWYAGAGRVVHPGFQQLASFMAMNPDRHLGSHLGFFDDVAAGNEDGADKHRAFYDEYLSVMDMTAEFFMQTVDVVFQQHAIARGTMTHRGERVEPEAITRTALFTVEGERDDIAGLGQTRAAHDLCLSLGEDMRLHYEQAGVGHYGIFSGSRWREQIMPRVRSFIRAHEAPALYSAK